MTHISDHKEGLVFEIVSARINEEKKHVVYTLQIRHVSGHDDLSPSAIDRRYTDFLNLYNSLKKEHAELMNNIPFPRKALWGNFDNDLISTRSTEFESLLKHIASNSKLRTSKGVLYFLQDDELKTAKDLIAKGEHSSALVYLENIFKLINKVFTDRSPGVLIALCRLLACSVIAQSEHSERWADLALHRYEGVSDSDLLQIYMPLLQICLVVAEKQGRPTDTLKERITSLIRQGVKLKEAGSFLEEVDALEGKLFVRD